MNNREPSFFSKLMVFILVLGLSLFLLVSIFNVLAGSLQVDSDGNSGNATPPVQKWATWDMEEEAPNAYVLVVTGDATRNEYIESYGTIHAAVKNRMAKKISYIQVSYGIYSDSGAKLGSCFANESNIPADGIWEFDAACTNLPLTQFHYRVDDVTYW